MRLFTAIDVPEAVVSQLAALREDEALDARWTPPDQYHVTLRFIGETTDTQADRYEEALSQIEWRPVHGRSYGLDVLPSRQNPSVLMVGLERTDSLLGLYEAVSDALETEGLEPENRTYRPHITIARLGDVEPESVHRFLRSHDDVSVEPFTAESFHLYESTLTQKGAIHERRASFPLKS